ncbi:Uncharacterised protein [Serratia quinivorans]|nr:Uncharacterised protein [Serratia quinivorans]CAI0747458.1 Uncharacterised protein [Serratia quinivorans]CAI0778363.1 Uncharacterised protein [Serratia quinivorans]CAI0887289.1 Uncharacterised protein [Serratia quinivorans]CAI0903087.1 Uncharacterised protein [Serratia quinivorans]
MIMCRYGRSYDQTWFRKEASVEITDLCLSDAIRVITIER